MRSRASSVWMTPVPRSMHGAAIHRRSPASTSTCHDHLHSLAFMTETNGVTRRDFVAQSATIAGGLLAVGDVKPAHEFAATNAVETRRQQIASHLTLWYRRPAQQWVEA